MCCAIRIIHRRKRLDGDEHDRHLDFAAEHTKGRRGRVGDHVDKEDVDVGCLNLGNRVVGGLSRIEQAKIADFNSFDQRLGVLLLAHHLVEQAVKLWPVDVVANTEEAGAGIKRAAARDFRTTFGRGGRGGCIKGHDADKKWLYVKITRKADRCR